MLAVADIVRLKVFLDLWQFAEAILLLFPVIVVVFIKFPVK